MDGRGLSGLRAPAVRAEKSKAQSRNQKVGARVVARDVVGLLGDGREVRELLAHRVDFLDRFGRLHLLASLLLFALLLLQLCAHLSIEWSIWSTELMCDLRYDAMLFSDRI